jgi:hypothetical protein
MSTHYIHTCEENNGIGYERSKFMTQLCKKNTILIYTIFNRASFSCFVAEIALIGMTRTVRGINIRT